jgi:hypothetical protein
MKLLITTFILFVFFSCNNSPVNHRTLYYINTQLHYKNDSITIETRIINYDTKTLEYEDHITTSFNNIDSVKNLIDEERIKAEQYLSIFKKAPYTTYVQ